MLLHPSRTNQPAIVILIPIFAILLWVNPVYPFKILSFNESTLLPLAKFLLSVIPPSTAISKILGLVSLLGIAFLISRFNTKYILITERTYLPAILYIIIVISVYKINDFSPVYISMLLLMLALERILDSYKYEHLSYNIFDAAFLTGISSLAYFNSIFLIVFIWITLIIIRPFHWREWLYTIIGLLLPYALLYSSYYLLSWDTGFFLKTIKASLLFDNKFELTLSQEVYLSFFLLLILISSQYIIKVMGSKKILSRKTYNLFLFMFLLLILMFFILKSASSELIVFAGLPLTMLLSHFFITAKDTRWKEFLFDLLIVGFIVLQILKV